LQKFTSIWLYDDSSSTYVNNTNNAASGTAFNLWEEVADVLYLGFSRETKGGVVTLSTNGSYGTFTWSYWNGSSWITIIPIIAYTFNQSKYFILPVPEDWQPRTFSATDPHTASVPDSISRYYWRITVSSVTTMAVCTGLYSIPEISYTTPTLVYRLLQFKQDFTNTSIPSKRAVIDLIKRAESRIDYRTRKSWKWNIENTSENTQLQIADYNRWGIPVRKTPILNVYSVSVWNGGAFQVLVNGRDQDYFVDNQNAMIYLSRMFLLPAAYGLQGRYFIFGAGEYKRAIQVEYSYGRNADLDPEFYKVQDIATKMAAIDIINSSDYTSLVSSGAQNVSLSEKIANWSDQVEQSLDELIGLIVW
jgi:hypothetical protein